MMLVTHLSDPIRKTACGMLQTPGQAERASITDDLSKVTCGTCKHTKIARRERITVDARAYEELLKAHAELLEERSKVAAHLDHSFEANDTFTAEAIRMLTLIDIGSGGNWTVHSANVGDDRPMVSVNAMHFGVSAAPTLEEALRKAIERMDPPWPTEFPK